MVRWKYLRITSFLTTHGMDKCKMQGKYPRAADFSVESAWATFYERGSVYFCLQVLFFSHQCKSNRDEEKEG